MVNEICKEDLEKVNEKLMKSLEDYRVTLGYMLGDAPIGILCLDKTLESVLIKAGCLRVYDLFNRDFTEIKGLGKARIRDLTTRLNEFVAMC